MISHKRQFFGSLVGLLVAVSATGCSTKASDGAGSDAPGVSEDTIKLGVITDLSGPFAASNTQELQGGTLFFEDKTYCGRKVEFEVKDTGYSIDRTKTAFTEIKDSVLAVAQSTGSPTTAAIASDLEANDLVTVASSYASSFLGSASLLVPGTTYEVETVNAVHYLVNDLGVAEGDKLGMVYVQGEFGEAGLAGAEHAADTYGLELVPQVAQATDTDLTAQVTALRNAGVKGIVVTGGPPTLNSVASVADAQDLDVPIVTNSPGFSESALETGAADALLANVYVVSSVAPFASDAAGPTALREQFEEAYPDEPAGLWTELGYGMAAIMGEILTVACENDALNRDGLVEAASQLAEVDTDGVLVPLDFSQRDASPSASSYVLRPDADTPGGLIEVADAFVSPAAQDYAEQ